VKEGNKKLARPYPYLALFLASSTSIFGAPKLSNSAPLIFGKQDHPILCAIFSSQGFGAPSPPLHAYLPRPLAFFCLVSLGSRSILYVFAPLFNFTFAD
jgi:hypothetical protein